MLDHFPRPPPGGSAEREEGIEGAGRKNSAALKFRRAKVAPLLEQGEIESKFADRHSDPRRSASRTEDAKRQILDWKRGFGADVDKRFHGERFEKELTGV